MAIAVVNAFVTLGTGQLESLVDFYQALLGLAPTVQLPNVYAEFQLPGLRLGLFRPQSAVDEARSVAKVPGIEMSGRSPQAQALAPEWGVGFCLEVVDLDAAIAHLATLGYPPLGPIRTASHGREVYAYDPDGNGFILHQGH
jgi:catechol 2,3-dioxygenase-like lactoylglutathione lyase family enzyme